MEWHQSTICMEWHQSTPINQSIILEDCKMKKYYIICLFLLGFTRIFAMPLDEALKLAKSVIPAETQIPLSAYMDTVQFRALLSVIREMSAADLARMLISKRDCSDGEILISATEKALTVDQYLELLSFMLQTINDDKTFIQRLLFPRYDKRGVLALNYQTSTVKEIVAHAKTRCQKDSDFQNLLKNIEQGIEYKNIISQKMAGVQDNFATFPAVNFKRDWESIRIIGLAIYKHDVDKLVSALESNAELAKSAQENIQLYHNIMKDDSRFSRSEALENSTILFDAQKPLMQIDLRDTQVLLLYKAIKNGHTLLLEQIVKTNDCEIRKVSIDSLYLTISSINDWRNYLSLLMLDDKNIRQYAYDKIKYVGQIDLDSPLTPAAIDSLAQKYQLFKDKREDQIKQ